MSENPSASNIRLVREAGTAIATLLGGQVPAPINERSYRRPHHRQHARAINQVVEHIREMQDYLVPLARGELDVEPPGRRNLLASPLKELHSQMRNLRWQAGQLAAGNLNQRFDCMGELSELLNRITALLREKERTIQLLRDRLAETGPPVSGPTATKPTIGEPVGMA
jgi:hypothetical protein